MQKKNHSYCKFTVLTIGLFITMTLPSMAQNTLGITASAGLGAFISTNKDYYGGISTDIYPELGGELNISLVRLGLKAGLIYRKYSYTGYTAVYSYGYNGYSYNYEPFNSTFKQVFIPVQAELLIAPPIGSGDFVFSPYFGGMIGEFIAAGDNSNSLFAISFKVGGEIALGGVVIPYGDIRYTIANDGGANAGGIMIVVGMGVRI